MPDLRDDCPGCGALQGLVLSWSGFDLVRVQPDGTVTVAEHAGRAADQMIASSIPDERLIGHMTRLIVAGHAALQGRGHG
jgi:hypothetical protein